MMLPMAYGVSPAAAPSFRHIVVARNTRLHSERSTRPCSASVARSASASSAAMYAVVSASKGTCAWGQFSHSKQMSCKERRDARSQLHASYSRTQKEL